MDEPVSEMIRGILRRRRAVKKVAFTPKEIEAMKKARKQGVPVDIPKNPPVSRLFKKEKKL